MGLLWGEQTWPTIRGCARAGWGVILPLGAMEQHGYHLPVDTDAANVYEVAARLAGAVDKVLALPALWTGFSSDNRDYPGTVTLRFDTWSRLVVDTCVSIARGGFRHIVLLNGHGGQHALTQAAAARLLDEHGLRALAVTWFRYIADAMREICATVQGGIDHAGEFETSVVAYLRPHLAAQGTLAEHRYESPLPSMPKASPAAFIPHLRQTLSPAGVVGAPSRADAAKGKAIIEAAVARLRVTVEEFLALDVDAGGEPMPPAAAKP